METITDKKGNPVHIEDSKLPLPLKGKHPLREGILGLEHTIAELKVMVAKMDIHAGLVAWIMDELDAKEKAGFSAAIVDLHVLDHANGDSGIAAHVQGKHHGKIRELPGREKAKADKLTP